MKKLTIFIFLITVSVLLNACSFKLPSVHERKGADVGYGVNKSKKNLLKLLL